MTIRLIKEKEPQFNFYMKRFLLPLLAALALPAAVNAFPFGRDLEIKNTIGERILVKGATVQTFLYGKENLIIKINQEIKREADRIPKIENKILRIKQNISEIERKKNDMERKTEYKIAEGIKRTCDENYRTDTGRKAPLVCEAYRNRNYDFIEKWDYDFPYQYKIRLAIKYIGYEQKKLLPENKKLEKVKEKIQELKKEKKDLEGYQFTNYFMNEIKYQPIFIDLNNKKTSLSDTRINCFNPKLSSKYVDLYKRVDYFVRINSDFISAPTNFDGNLVGEKICKKYAKF